MAFDAQRVLLAIYKKQLLIRARRGMTDSGGRFRLL